MHTHAVRQGPSSAVQFSLARRGYPYLTLPSSTSPLSQRNRPPAYTLDCIDPYHSPVTMQRTHPGVQDRIVIALHDLGNSHAGNQQADHSTHMLTADIHADVVRAAAAMTGTMGRRRPFVSSLSFVTPPAGNRRHADAVAHETPRSTHKLRTQQRT